METTTDNKLFYKNLTRISLPIALQSLMLAMVAAADALMLGRVAQEQMTAVSLATQIQFVQNMFIFSATSAGAILGAQYWGKGDTRAVERVMGISLRITFMISALFTLAGALVPGAIMRIFTADTELIDAGSRYLQAVAAAYVLWTVVVVE